MICWKCQKNIESKTSKIGFRETCIHCDADLHVCKNCKHYRLGKPNDCDIPDIDKILDKEKSNLCEEFSPCLKTVEKKVSNETTERIFGKDALKNKKGFNDLFKD